MVNEQVSLWGRRLAVGMIIVLTLMGTAMGEVTRAGLAAEWHFDGDAKDSSGNGIDGTIYAGTFTDGKFGKALSLNGGNSSYADFGEGGGKLDFGTGPFSIEFWMNYQGFTVHPNVTDIMGKTLGNANSAGYLAWTTTWGGDGSNYGIFIATTTASWGNGNAEHWGAYFPNKWYHIVLVREGNSWTIYKNGENAHSETKAGMGLSVDNNANFKIGESTGEPNFKGLIDEVRIYNRALSAGEVKANYEAGQLVIISSPSGSEVVVDGVSKGNAAPTLIIPGVSPGSHKVNCRLTGYSDYETIVNVITGTAVQIPCSPSPLPVLTTITVSPTTVSIAVDGTRIFTITPKDQFSNTMSAIVTWTSSNSSVGVIDNNGLFTAKASGTTIITAANGTISGNAAVTVTESNRPPNVPNSPSPTTGDVNQSINPTLSWSGGDPDSGDTVTYTVYLDTNSNPTASKCSSITSTSCPVTGLSYSTHYYWKVTANDGKASPVSGPVWSFTTQGEAGQPTTGNISVTSSPSGATVFVDDVSKGTASPILTMSGITPGSHTVECTLSGYEDYKTTITVTVGTTASATCPLSLTGAIVVSVSSVPVSIKPGQTSVIKVTATGKDNQSIPGATVMLYAKPASGGKISPALGTTDINGIFTSSFNGSAEGEVTINTLVRKENLLEGKKDIQILIQPKNSDNISLVAISLISIKGIITDSETGQPVSGATVAIGSIPNKTGLDGKYELKVYAGEYDNLTITREGYEAVTKSVIVPEGGRVVDFSIKKNPTIAWYWILLLLVPISGGLGYAKYKKKSQKEKEILGLRGNLKPEGTPAQESAPFAETLLTHTIDKNPTVKVVTGNKIDVKSAYEYRCAKILYKVRLENNTSETMGDIKVNLFVPQVFLLKEKEKPISMLEPKESATVTFEIRPTGECGDCNISGKVEYYDYNTKRHEMLDIGTKMVSVICPILKRKEIDIKQWEHVTDELIKAEENINELSVPAENLFDITSRVIKDNGMFMLKPEITSTPKLFVGCAKFFALGKMGLRYAAYIEVVGGSNKSRLILKVWAEKEEALTGFYHRILDEIEKRVDVKIFIDDVQQYIHIDEYVGRDKVGRDKVGTQINDSFVKNSSIGAGGRKCPNCGREIEENEESCRECGSKL